MMLKCGKNKKGAYMMRPSTHMSLMFLPHLDIFCDLLLYRPAAIRNLFVLTDVNTKCVA